MEEDMRNFITKFNTVNNGLAAKFSNNINPKTVSWFTDGSCHGNGRKSSSGGYASICVSGNSKNIVFYSKVDDRSIKATNIRAEGLAILSVLEYSLSNIKSSQWDNTIIYTDSEFWVKMIYNYMPKWSESGLDFNKKANPDLTKKIYNIYNQINLTKSIELKHVYAHNKDKSANSSNPFKRFCHDNNELADDLANLARELPDYNCRSEML